MSILSLTMLALFVLALMGAIGFWFYAARGLIPLWWAQIWQQSLPNAGLMKRRIAIGLTGFVLMAAIAVSAGLVAEFGGGWV